MMWLGNIILWNQFTDSTGVKFVHKTKTKHDMDKISVIDNNCTLLYVPWAYMKHVDYAHRFTG